MATERLMIPAVIKNGLVMPQGQDSLPAKVYREALRGNR
jgi:hypothetical protein